MSTFAIRLHMTRFHLASGLLEGTTPIFFNLQGLTICHSLKHYQGNVVIVDVRTVFRVFSL